VSPRKQ